MRWIRSVGGKDGFNFKYSSESESGWDCAGQHYGQQEFIINKTEVHEVGLCDNIDKFCHNYFYVKK